MAKELHFYRWDCKDYLAESAPLTDAQDLYYRRLMDLCALRGGRIDLSDEAICRAVRARSSTQKKACLEVLRDFFQGVSGDHSHPWINRALALHESTARKSKAGGEAKAQKIKVEQEEKRNATQSEKPNAVEKPLQINDGGLPGGCLGSAQSVVSSQYSDKDLKHLSADASERGSAKQVKNDGFDDWASRTVRFYNEQTQGKGHQPARSVTKELGKALRKMFDRKEHYNGRVYRFSDPQTMAAYIWAIAEDKWAGDNGLSLINLLRGQMLGTLIERALAIAEEQSAAAA